jgi:hypothetical protein
VSGRKRIPELQSIEFNGSPALAKYTKTGRDLCRDLAWEFASAAYELESVLRAQKGHPLLFGLDVRLSARSVRIQLLRAAEAQVAAAAAMVRTNQTYRRLFLGALEEAKRRRAEDAKNRKKWEL